MAASDDVRLCHLGNQAGALCVGTQRNTMNSVTEISRYLHMDNMSFIGNGMINVGPNTTMDYAGYGPPTDNLTFNVHGSNPYDLPKGHGVANAHLVIDYARGFSGTINLRDWGDVILNGIAADSYKFDGHHLTLFAGGLADYGMNINAKGPLWVFHDGPSALRVSTEIRSPGEGLMFGLPVHA
jgi:hypothetical protein